MLADLTPNLLLVFIQCQHYFTEDVEMATYLFKEPTELKK